MTPVNPPSQAQQAHQTRQTFQARYLSAVQNPMELVPLLARAYPTQATLADALAQLDLLKRCLDSFRPLDPQQLRNLYDKWDTEYTYESNRIEGNSLTLRETYLVVAKGLTIGGKSLDEHLEARNHQEAIYYVRDVVEQRQALSEYLINAIHALVLSGIKPQYAGKYRNIGVEITNARHVPPQPYLVPKQMEEVFIWYAQQRHTRHPVLLAADMHQKVVTVHPWVDGNGRTSRLIMNLILMQHGFPIARIAGDTDSRMAYYEALDIAQADQNSEPFQLLIAAYVRQALLEYVAMASSNIGEAAAGKGDYFFEQMAAFSPL